MYDGWEPPPGPFDATVGVIAWLLTALSLAVALWLLVLVVLDRRPSDVVTYALLVVEAVFSLVAFFGLLIVMLCLLWMLG